jgi:hypothetical protein
MIQVIGGIAAGAAAMMLAPSIMATIVPVFRPIAKSLIKGGLRAVDFGKQAIVHSGSAIAGAVQTTRSVMAGTVESIEDLAAEARAEIAEAQKASAKAGRKKQA